MYTTRSYKRCEIVIFLETFSLRARPMLARFFLFSKSGRKSQSQLALYNLPSSFIHAIIKYFRSILTQARKVAASQYAICEVSSLSPILLGQFSHMSSLSYKYRTYLYITIIFTVTQVAALRGYAMTEQ